MAPPRQVVHSGGRKLGRDRNAVQTVLHEVTKQENRKALVTVAMFAAGVAFFHSGLSDFIAVTV